MAQRLRYIFAHNLRTLVQHQGLKINRLADDAGVSRAQMYNVLAARSSPSLDWICKVAHVLGVTPAQLLVDALPPEANTAYTHTNSEAASPGHPGHGPSDSSAYGHPPHVSGYMNAY